MSTTTPVQRWGAIADRLVRLAEDHGGYVAREDNRLMLHAAGEGACIRITPGEPGKARVDADDLHVSCDWALAEGDFEDLEQVVADIIAGKAEVTVTSQFRVGNTYGGLSGPMTWKLPAWPAKS